MSEYVVRPLEPGTWDGFAGLAERHNGVFGGCWCTWFHTMSAEKERTYEANRSLKRRLVDELEALRPRERMIVTLYAEGLAVDDIAQVLVISPHTVRTHVKNAFRRLGVHSRDEAARLVFADEVRRLL